MTKTRPRGDVFFQVTMLFTPNNNFFSITLGEHKLMFEPGYHEKRSVVVSMAIFSASVREVLHYLKRVL